MKKNVGTVLSFLILAQAAQAGLNSKFDYLVMKIVEAPERHELPDMELRALSHVVPNDPTQPRQADYLTLLGVQTDTFIPMEMAAYSETWIIDEDGNWRIDRWTFKVSPSTGKLLDIYRHELRQTRDRRIIGETPLETKPANDPESIARWEALLNKWYGWID